MRGAEYFRAKSAERYRVRGRLGVCKSCDNPIDKTRSRSRCSSCLDKIKAARTKEMDRASNERRKTRNQERYEAGLCIDCAKINGNLNFKRCFNCRRARATNTLTI